MSLPAMDLSSIFQAVLETKRDGSRFSLADLRPGDRLTGRVLQLETDGRVLIDLGRFRASARIGFPVTEGQILQLKVIQSDSTLHLQAQVEPGTPTQVSLPQLNFNQVFTPAQQKQWVGLMQRTAGAAKSGAADVITPSNVQHALTLVQSVFDAIPVEKPVLQLAQWLRSAVEDRGTFFETKLADMVTAGTTHADKAQTPDGERVRRVIVQDLKANLLILKSHIQEVVAAQTGMEPLSFKELELMGRGVDKLLDHVTQQQERATQNWREGDSFQIITHMLDVKEQQLPVQLKVHHPKKGANQGEDAQHRVALLLQMNYLGPVRADLVMAGRNLKIQFFVQHEVVRQSFMEQSGEMADALKGLFDEVIIHTRVSETRIARFSQPERHGVSVGRIDIQV